MINRIRREIVDSYSRLDTIAMALISIVALVFKPVAGFIGIGITAALWLYHKFVSEKKILKRLSQYKDTVINEREDMMQAFSEGAPILVCALDRSKNIQWSSRGFDEVFGEDGFEEIRTSHILDPLYESEDNRVDITVGDNIYNVNSTFVGSSGLRMLFWRNITSREKLKAMLKASRLCLALVNIDNYDDILQSTAIEKRSAVAASIDSKIYAWAKEMNAAIYKTSESKYTIAFQQQYLQALREKKFEVLNAMHEVETEADFPTSISIGVSFGETNFEELQSAAEEAMELALGRGGDQAVVRKRGGETEYYGGALPSVEKLNKGKSRVMAHALQNLISDSEVVLVFGHSRPDMDSFGAAIGIFALANNMGKEVHIVLNECPDEIDAIYHQAASNSAYSFISHAEALEKTDDNTLVIMVDHHRKAISEAPEVLERAKRLVVIDHHRRAADAIDNVLLLHSESYASSASEMVAELLMYSGDRGEINRFEAEALLAGIALDTKNFTVNTGVRSFEAAGWLKRCGADTNNVKSYFKIDLDFYQKKLNIIANAQILENGVAVAYTKDSDPAMGMLVSQAADELLLMKGVEAAVAAGRGPSQTMVSARSSGKYNVQTLMEKLGGGGHQTAAAVQLDVGPEEAISSVVQAMRLEGML